MPRHILPVIVFAQFAGTSLWFAGNAVAADLQTALHLPADATGDLTSAVQLGFIAGTLIFAVLSVADRFSPVRVFLVSAVLAACFNLGVVWLAEGLPSLLALRCCTGFFLAGIYPVGMKISADWYQQGLGRALGWLVGALVLGTAFPHLLRGLPGQLPWQGILLATSVLAVGGALLLWLTVGDGPHRRPAAKFSWGAIPHIFRFAKFRSAAFGYFGHMWELYAMWAFVPAMLVYFSEKQNTPLDVPLWSFLVIATGAVGCVVGGYFSTLPPAAFLGERGAAKTSGSAKVARAMLLTSGLCCLLSPLFFGLPQMFFLAALLVWGFAVVGDSPQFSTIVARTAPPAYIGTALTIVNCIGFALTIGSIQLLDFLQNTLPPERLYLLLLPGPALGLGAMRRKF